MPDGTTPAAAQLTYTTNVFASPEFIGTVVSLIGMFAGKAGVHIFDDQQMQSILGVMVGMALGGIGHYFFPNASGRLSLSAPTAAGVPSPQNVPAGPSVVTVPKSTDWLQIATVQPIGVGKQVVTVTPATAPAERDAVPMAVAVTPHQG